MRKKICLPRLSPSPLKPALALIRFCLKSALAFIRAYPRQSVVANRRHR